jgi:hypothetical protein
MLLFSSYGIVHLEFISEGHTVNNHRYKEILRRPQFNLNHRKHPELWRRKKWLLLHENAPEHRTVFVQAKRAKQQVTVLLHPR